MTIYIVKYSTGSWDDFSVHDHSAWDKEEIADGISDKINAEIARLKMEPEPKETTEITAESMRTWNNWFESQNLNESWVQSILVNNIMPNQEIEFNLQSITNK